MKYNNYESVHIASDLSVFEFVSIGKYGRIPKRIVFMKTNMVGVYNLAFGNIDANNQFDDDTVNDNGDRNKILATIAKAVETYTRRYPRRWIYFEGNTEKKTRLYRMAVGLNLEELSLNFEIYARLENEDEFTPFYKNMKINAFLIRRRIRL